MENLPNDIKSLILDDVEQKKRAEGVRESNNRQLRDNLIQDQERHLNVLINEFEAAQVGFEPNMRTVFQERIAVDRLARRIDQMSSLIGDRSPEEYSNDANKIANMNTLMKAQESLIAMKQRLALKHQRDMHEFLQYGLIL